MLDIVGAFPAMETCGIGARAHMRARKHGGEAANIHCKRAPGLRRRGCATGRQLRKDYTLLLRKMQLLFLEFKELTADGPWEWGG
jgi:hypothetical protein